MKTNKLIIISGPTASGKTSTSIEVAKITKGEVVNFDSLVFYKEISIGTAKPTEQEMEGIPHHFVSNQSISDPLNAATYSEMAIPKILEIQNRGLIPILVGGSGFYLQAVIKGMYDSPTPDPQILERSDSLYNVQGIAPFLEELKNVDQVSLEKLHENDHYRIRRALEHFWSTGKPFSQAKENMQDRLKKSPSIIHDWDIFHAYLDIPRDQHQKIIINRVDEMLDLGLVEEVNKLLSLGFDGSEKPLKSIGYKETIDYIQGKFENIDAYKERIAISTRQLAKAQRTWFSKEEKTQYNILENKNDLIKDIKKFIRSELV
jgi:tRNA dimethylallyltransferase